MTTKLECNICASEIEEDNGDVVGVFGISPVSFCVWCISGLIAMVKEIGGCKCE